MLSGSIFRTLPVQWGHKKCVTNIIIIVNVTHNISISNVKFDLCADKKNENKTGWEEKKNTIEYLTKKKVKQNQNKQNNIEQSERETWND